MTNRLSSTVVSFVLVLQALLSYTASGQAIIPSVSQLNFGTVFENAPDSIALTLTNSLSRPVTVNRLRFYTIYGAPAFSVAASASAFTIPASGTRSVWIRFSPRHNILHNSELIIENDGLRGAVRVDLVGQGRYSNAYYAATENLAEEPLKAAIRTTITTGYVSMGYVVARDSMFMQIDNLRRNGQGATQNTIQSCYTGALAVGYVDRTDCQTNYGFNTEHTFPQGFFGSLEPMRSDLHHLFPCDDLSNNQRGSNPFAYVNSNIIWSDGGSVSDGTSFEPRDIQKGKAARSLLYFVLRYQDYANFVQPQESLLRSWHSLFLPDAIERRRNNDIYANQNNRNPFVDYPQFVERIQSVVTTSVAPVQRSLDFPEDTIVYGYVATGSTATYAYVIVNNGNTSIDLSNFALSQPAVFSFVGGSGTVTLQPGEAHVVQILAAPQSSSSILASLTFSTTLPGQSSVLVPVYLNDPLINAIDSPSSDFRLALFPNPTNGRVSLRGDFSGTVQVTIFDMPGKSVYQASRFNAQLEELDLSLLPAGTYVVAVSGPDFSVKQLLVKH
jgi:hypothetical protein